MEIKPFLDRILAQEIKGQDLISQGGIEFKVESQIKKAKVVSIANQIKNQEIKENFTIFYDEDSVATIEANNNTYILIKFADILAYSEE